MLDAIFDLTPAALRGWFPTGLPLSAAAAARVGFAVDPATAPLDRLRALADRARQAGLAADDADLIAAAVLHSVLRCLVGRAFAEHGFAALAEKSHPAVDAFATLYPPAAGAPNDARALVEAALLTLAEDNPAMKGLGWLFERGEDADLAAAAGVFESAVDALGADVDGEPLMAALRRPLEAGADLSAQLEFVLTRWRTLLPTAVVEQLLRTRDLMAEAHRPRFEGPGPAAPISFAAPDEEVEAFTPDRDWMTTVVLIAKLTHVWLHQLGETYGEAITRIDQIPDAELDRFAEWGITGLWLIGLWQRSPASATIKRRMGNPEAIASAYSLHDYVIADDLGGQKAYDDLRARCAARGIRLAADMVPNHVGVDGRWVIEHPERFLQLDRPPYPNYRFSGPDLSTHPDVGVYLEDGYWDHSDAAVVFKRLDRRTGAARYLYHGNDGTQMPWNDTAQIDYLDPDAREAVIQMILEVARRFDIIRFDAAMTLARRHIRRLWHPAPGDGGAVPSRSEHGASPAEFEARMPAEFWREVVDRVQAEVPDTLLLAEAFWLMEGYFVRTLGMHRVYNSAFMHMLKDEDNAGYRQTIANTLAFSPAVLQRFVNFMNNPDEETAVAQFGKGDKYFGVATLLVTLPGLPMIGHGQVEGFAEKYGMEYQRAYKDEAVDAGLVERHARQIFPLVHKRYLFSEADHFALYDVLTDAGAVDENVFAYSNRAGAERAIVVYNNSYGRTAGRFSVSSPINIAEGGETELVTRTLSEALDLATDATLYSFRDHVSGQHFLRTGAEFAADGLAVTLEGYQTRVFLDFRALEDDPAWRTLAAELAGQGVPDLDEARRGIVLRPVLDAFADLLATLVAVSDAIADDSDAMPDAIAGDSDAISSDAGVISDAIADDAGAKVDDTAGTFEALAAAHGLLAETSPAFGEPAGITPELAVSLRLAGLLARLTPRGRADVRLRAIERLGAETVGLAEALAEGAPLVDAADIPAAWASRVAGPAARAWLDVHAHEGVRWYRDERMQALVEAHLAGADLEDAARDAAKQALVAHLDAAAWRYDALLGDAQAPASNPAADPGPDLD